MEESERHVREQSLKAHRPQGPRNRGGQQVIALISRVYTQRKECFIEECAK